MVNSGFVCVSHQQLKYAYLRLLLVGFAIQTRAKIIYKDHPYKAAKTKTE
jgi:hypothetical protein